MNPIDTIDVHELSRLRDIERTWHAVFDALKVGNAQAFQGPGTGRECALREIRRLQNIAAYQPGTCRGIIGILLRRLGVEHVAITQADLDGMVGTYLIEGFEGDNLLLTLGYRDKSDDN